MTSTSFAPNPHDVCCLIGLVHTSFEGLDEGVIPVFPIERSITIKSYSIRRKQVPTCAAFSLTDYKVQGQTFIEAILDLKNDTGTRGRDATFTFNLVCRVTFTSKVGHVRH